MSQQYQSYPLFFAHPPPKPSFVLRESRLGVVYPIFSYLLLLYWSIMPRTIKLRNELLTLKDSEIEGFLERVVTPFGTSAKADVPKKYIGRRVYVVITKGTERMK